MEKRVSKRISMTLFAGIACIFATYGSIALESRLIAQNACENNILEEMRRASKANVNTKSIRFRDSKDRSVIFPVSIEYERRFIGFLRDSGFSDMRELKYTLYQLDDGNFFVAADKDVWDKNESNIGRKRIYGATFDTCARLVDKPSIFFDRSSAE